MKKALSILLALLMLVQGVFALADETETAKPTEEITEEAAEGAADEASEEGEAELPEVEYDYDLLTVGTATPFSGCFFTQMWGNVGSDLDVRILIHGYNLIEWRNEEGIYNIDPSVVRDMTVTQNGAGDRTFTLTLCDDLFYCDGTEITARDYAFTMLLSIAPEIAAIGASTRPLEYLVGYEDYVSGKTNCLAGVRILGDHKLSIAVSHKYLPVFFDLALLDCTPYPISAIAPGCRVADDGKGAYIANIDADEKEPLFTAELLRQTILDPETGYRTHPEITSGPYRLVSYDGTTAEFEVNEYYKGNSEGIKPAIKRIRFTTTANEDMIAQLKAGEVMLLNKAVPAEVIQAGLDLVDSGDTFAMTSYPRSGLSFISFSCEKDTVGSENVRKAISLCLDKDGLIADSLGTFGMRVDGYYGLGQWMYQLVSGLLPYPVEEPAEGEDTTAYEKELAAWQALSLDEVSVYNLNVDAAVTLLVEEGYTLNEAGEAFDPAKDAVRCKKLEDGTLVPLKLTLLASEGTTVTEHLQEHFVDHLAEAGIELTVNVVPMTDLLKQYYRVETREADMFFLATNFDLIFDPSLTFQPDGEEINGYNPTGLADEELYRLALDMRMTEPGDLMGYCTKWVALQERFQEVTPIIPIYSSMYFDFYPTVLRNYDISANVSWSEAVISAYLSDEPVEGE